MIPFLPYELNRDIILHSLPVGVFGTCCEEQCHFLQRYSLVSPVWREIAQSELMKYLYIDYTESLGGLIKEFERRKAASLSTRVVCLKLNFRAATVDWMVKRQFERVSLLCKDAEEIWIDASHSLPILVCLGSAGYSNLTSLHLRGGYCVTKNINSGTNLCFPALTHLTIIRANNRWIEWVFETVLKPSITPSLNSLAFLHCSPSDSLFNTLAPSVARKMKRFILIDFPEYQDSINVSSMKALETLVIQHVPQLLSLTNISSNLSTIYISEIRTGSYEKKYL